MKFSKTKNAFLLTVLIFIIVSFAVSAILDPLQSTREELKRIYAKEFKEFTIDHIISVPYPTGKGNYKLFSSRIHQEYYPILLEFGDDPPYDLFKIGTKINKPAFSVNMTLREGEVINHVRLRHPNDENIRAEGLFPAAFFGFIFVLFLVLPNTFFEKLLSFVFNDKEWS